LSIKSRVITHFVPRWLFYIASFLRNNGCRIELIGCLELTFYKKIMKVHGGGIEAVSKEREGTTFLLKFPAQVHPG
jgi:signal transduction histidine kinase